MFGGRRRQRPPRPPSLPSPPPEEVFIGGDPSPFSANDLARERRNEAAASLIDAETHGYLLLRLSRDETGDGMIHIEAHIAPAHHDAFKTALKKLIRVGFA